MRMRFLMSWWTRRVLTHFHWTLAQMLLLLWCTRGTSLCCSSFTTAGAVRLMMLWQRGPVPLRAQQSPQRETSSDHMPAALFPPGVCLHGRHCLHWHYEWNQHIKPRWAVLSKPSLQRAGWHGHSKYSLEHSAGSSGGAALWYPCGGERPVRSAFQPFGRQLRATMEAGRLISWASFRTLV